MNEKQFFGIRDVAEFCKVNPSALYYHIEKGHLIAHQRIGNSPMFMRSAVEEFRDMHYCDVGVTKVEIANEYGISPSLVQAYQNQGKLTVQPGKRGRAHLYDVSEAERVFAKYKTAQNPATAR